MSREVRILLLALALFLLVNGVTLSRYPSVWVDEVQFADPAVSLASGEGFTSTAWFAQDSTKFWAGNVPLYPLLLGGWLSAFGVGLIAERWLNLVLFTAFVLLMWSWMRNSSIVRTEAWRIAAVILLLCGHAMVFSYRSGRYDVTGMLLASIAAALWERRLWLMLPAALLPFAGLQLIPAALVFCVLVVVFGGRRSVFRATLLATGLGAGWLALWGFYAWFGTWDDFRASTTAIGLIGNPLTAKIASLPKAYLADKSRILVAAAFVLLLWLGRRTPDGGSRRICGFVLALLLMLPAALHLAGKFPIYYGWMVFVPLVVATVHMAERTEAWRRPVLALFALSAFVGLPLRLVCAASASEDRAPARMSEFVRRTVPKGSLVLADFKAYYALRESGFRPLLPTYVPALRADQRESVNLLVIRPEDARHTQQQLGGEWHATGAVLAPPASPGFLKKLVAELREEDYNLAVYRRVAGPAT